MRERGKKAGLSMISRVSRPLAWVYLPVMPSLTRVPLGPLSSMPLERRRMVAAANWASVMGMESMGMSLEQVLEF